MLILEQRHFSQLSFHWILHISTTNCSNEEVIFFRWLFKNAFQLRKLLKKLPVVAHKQRFPLNSEPNWPSYLFPLFPQYFLRPKSLGCSFGALYTHHGFLSSQPLHERMEIWPTKQAIFAMFFPPLLWYHRASATLLMKSPRVKYKQRREQPPCTMYLVRLRQRLPNSCSVSCPFELSCAYS